MTECQQEQENLARCTCTYARCGIRGRCCECVARHRERGELPGCFFSAEAERTYDRSVARFIAGRS